MKVVQNLVIVVGLVAAIVLGALPPRWFALAGVTFADYAAVDAAFHGDAARLTAQVRALMRDARMWRQELAPLRYAAPSLEAIPIVGGELAALNAMDNLLVRVTDAIEPTLWLYDGLQARLDAGMSPGEALLATAQEDAWQLQAARAAVEKARQGWETARNLDCAAGCQGLIQGAGNSLDEWSGALQLLERAPQLLGADRPRRYLVLAQNNDELRPTGGFISAVGLLRIERGQVSVEWFADSFSVDDLSLIHPPPPAPLEKYMWATQWLVRDSNWYADFPTSARIAQQMVARDKHVQTDGVIAVDTRWMPRLVGAVDGLIINGKRLEEQNVVALLKASWKPLPPGDMSAEWFTGDRKSFLSDLFKLMLRRVDEGGLRTAPLAKAFWEGAREKSVQLYFNDAASEQAVSDAGWGGALNPGNGDYLFAVDSNLGFNKVNARVNRSITYSVRLGEERSAVVEIEYENTSQAAAGGCDLLGQRKDATYASMEQSCYWDYVRVLTPRGSVFAGAQGVSDAGTVTEHSQVSAFGGYAVIPRATTSTVRFGYTLPARVLRDDVYTLNIGRQAGAAPTPLTIRIQLPPGKTVASASLPYVMRGEGVVEFRVIVTGDMAVTVRMKDEG